MTCCMFPLSILQVLQSVDHNSEVLHLIVSDNEYSFFNYFCKLLNKRFWFWSSDGGTQVDSGAICLQNCYEPMAL